MEIEINGIYAVNGMEIGKINEIYEVIGREIEIDEICEASETEMKDGIYEATGRDFETINVNFGKLNVKCAGIGMEVGKIIVICVVIGKEIGKINEINELIGKIDVRFVHQIL